MSRSALAPCNYEFQVNGVDENGLAKVLLSPKRKERVLVSGAMFLRPADGELVRVQGRLAKSPSFWVKTVDIVRTYDRIEGVGDAGRARDDGAGPAVRRGHAADDLRLLRDRRAPSPVSPVAPTTSRLQTLAATL